MAEDVSQRLGSKLFRPVEDESCEDVYLAQASATTGLSSAAATLSRQTN